jgi:hypothetical protein
MKTKKHYLLFTILLLQVSYSNAQLELNDFITELNNPTGLVIHGDDLYFSGINNKIFKVNTQIKNSKPIEVFQGGTQLRCHAVSNDILYFTNDSKISRINLKEENPTASDLVTNIYAYGIAIKGNDLYFAERDKNRISKINLTIENQSPTIIISNLNGPTDLVVKGNELYIAEESAGAVSKIDLSMDTPTPSNVITGLNAPDQLLLINSELYIVEQLSYKVSKIDLSESLITSEDVITGLAGPSGIAFYENCFYISETYYVTEAVGKISKGCNPSISLNDNYPTDIMLSTNSIKENISKATIGQLTATDLDLPSDSHTFKLVNGIGDDDNSSFIIIGENLTTNIAFDFEVQQTLSIRIKVIDENNQSFEKSIVINIVNINDINTTSETTDSYCSESSGTGEINITSVNQTLGTVTYNWTANNGGVIPSGQENNQNLTELVNGTYYLSVTDDNFTYNKTFEVSLIQQYDLKICYVSGDDSEITKNRIYLNNQGNYNVAFYEILRESNVANVYTAIGKIKSTENSFLDNSSNNISQSYNYKVRLIDNCSITSSNSDLHKTMLLQSSIAVDETINLNWSDYQGTSFTTYNIFRNKNQEGFQMIGSVSASNNSYNDTTANVADNNYEYYISIEVDACLSQSARRKPNSSTEIKSNHQNIGSSLSLNDFISLKELSIYPNPSSINLNIKLSTDITFMKGEIYNTLGQIIMEIRETKFSIENLPSATYFIKIFTSKGITTRRFIKNRN